MIVQEKLGRVVPRPLFETSRLIVLLPANWNLSTSPTLRLAIKLFEIGTIWFAVFATAVDWLSALSVPFTTALTEIVETVLDVAVASAVY